MAPTAVTPAHSTARVAAGAVIISFSPVFVAVAHAGPTAIAFYRMLVGAVILVPLTWLARQPRSPLRAYPLLSVCGIVLAADLVVWHHAIHGIGPGMATMMGNFQVLFVSAYGVVALRERPSARFVTGVVLALAGLVLVFGGSWSQVGTRYHWGILFGTLTALLYAAFLLALRAVQLGRGAPSATTALTVLSVIGAAALAIAVPLSGESFAIADGVTLAALLSYGIVSQVVGWLLITQGLPGIPASRGALLLLLQPFLSFTWDVVFFHRVTTAREAIGVAVALTAIYLGSVSHPAPEPA